MGFRSFRLRDFSGSQGSAVWYVGKHSVTMRFIRNT